MEVLGGSGIVEALVQPLNIAVRSAKGVVTMSEWPSEFADELTSREKMQGWVRSETLATCAMYFAERGQSIRSKSQLLELIFEMFAESAVAAGVRPVTNLRQALSILSNFTSAQGRNVVARQVRGQGYDRAQERALEVPRTDEEGGVVRKRRVLDASNPFDATVRESQRRNPQVWKGIEQKRDEISVDDIGETLESTPEEGETNSDAVSKMQNMLPTGEDN